MNNVKEVIAITQEKLIKSHLDEQAIQRAAAKRERRKAKRLVLIARQALKKA